MGRARGLGTMVAVAVVVAIAAGGCSDDSKKSATTKEPTEACKIRPGGNCAKADLATKNLSGANLTGASLKGANLSGANLTNANLSGANLTSANLTKAILVNTDLRAANLTGANFTGATLSGVALADAKRCGTIRTNGSIDNTRCPPTGTAATGAPAVTTTAAATPSATNCNTQAFSAALGSQGGYYGLSEQVLQSSTPNGAPACSTSFATQGFTGPATAGDTGSFKAVFSVAPNNGWHLLSVTGCQPAMNVPPDQARGIC